MWKENLDLCQKTGVDFWTRFEAFRGYEAYCLTLTGNPTIAAEAWELLHDLEHAYASRAYSACFGLACAMIEIHLRKELGLRGKLAPMLKKVGLDEELGWLVTLRNDIMHGNPNQFVRYTRTPELVEELEKLCEKAFLAIHTIAAKTSKASLKKAEIIA